MPQLTYVRGQELNLSGGVLVVDNGKKTTEIPLDSEDVTVSGYNKDTLGEQTVTVEYDGVTTEITVTVVERMVISDVVTDYLVGDSPDMTKGKIVVTEDDGSSKTIYFAGNGVSVSGFDSSREKTGMEVKVTCSVGSKSYEGSFKVNIHAVESVDFHRPNKITYNSHYTGKADITGGYLVLKGNNGKLSRTVNLTDDMISGFDVSAVTAENSPLTQAVTVTYDGTPYTYEIKITYTDISMFRDNADAFNSIDWNGENEPKIESELGELALTLMDAYVEMSKADRALIDETAAFNVARAAMVYGFDVWAENIRLFEGAFGIELGELVLYCESYEKVENALKLFEDKDSAIYTLAPLLLDIIEIYGNRVVYQNDTTLIKFSSYPILNDSYLTYIISVMEHVLDIYDALDTVPDNWSVSDLKTNGTAIEYIYVKILTEGYTQSFPRLYYLVSEWREADDLFDVLYTYFYETDQKDVMLTLSSFCLPSGVEELYLYVSSAITMMDTIQNLQYLDTTDFFYNYYQALELADKIKSEEGTLANYVYWNVPLNRLLGSSSSQNLDFETLLAFVRTSNYGYYDLSSCLLGIKAYDELMAEYVRLVKNISETDGYMDTAEYGESVQKIFNTFISLSPTQQYGFLSILNTLYAYGIPELSFDDSEENKELISTFNIIINSFMRSKLSEEQKDTYDNLILAIEIYANRFGYEDWESDFTSRMDKVTAALPGMNDWDRQSFDKYLGDAYEKYSAIRAGLNKATDLGEWADEFDLMRSAIMDIQIAYSLIEDHSSAVYNYFFAAYERLAFIANDIINRAPEKVVMAYYHEALFEMYSADAEAGTEAVCCTYDYAVSLYRNLFTDYLIFFGSSKINLYDTYIERNMGEFLNAYYDMVNAFMNREEGETTFDVAKTLAAIKQFRLLDSESKAFFMIMEGEIDMYYAALELFISEELSAGAAEVATKLYTLEQYYYNYQLVPNDVTLDSLKAVLNQIQLLYVDLSGDDKTSFAYLEEAYGYYIDKCEALLAA